MKLNTIIRGEALEVLRTLPSTSVDAVITDPPYSSGGMFRSDRNRSTTEKYQTTGTSKTYNDFPGDSRDQRSFLLWSTWWLTECYRIVKDGGVCGVFTDWRQLPTVTDAVQVSGFVWRGIGVWDKAEADRACRVLFAKERWPMTVYRCQFCGAWHVGHMPRKNILAMRERREAA